MATTSLGSMKEVKVLYLFIIVFLKHVFSPKNGLVKDLSRSKRHHVKKNDGDLPNT